MVDALELDRPSAFGHSCGAAALLLAEQCRPGTFGSLYCFEPILYPAENPPAPTRDGNPLAVGAARRRDVFASRQAAIDNYSGRPPFDRLDGDVLADYVDNGFAPDPDGIRLRCRREDEAEVYAHGMAHDAFAHLDRVRCPVVLACGEETDAVGPAFLALLAPRLPRPSVEVFDAMGHFGPLESPAVVARSVVAALDGGRGRGDDTPTA
ncbi:MAG: alpha/beta fold hydrolase [Acidimicrobiales bacterium]